MRGVPAAAARNLFGAVPVDQPTPNNFADRSTMAVSSSTS